MSRLLEVEALVAGHGEAVVLENLSFSLEAGTGMALLGRNGMGKTTLIDSLIGVTRRFSGRIVFDGRDVSALPPEKRAATGIGWVPQERNIFRSLTVEENITAVMRRGAWTLPRLYEMFPRLKERRRNMGNQLSGGEQQMLSIGRALMTHPELIILDEATEGLAPLIVAEIWRVIALIRDSGISTLIVDRNARMVLAHTDHAVVMEKGRIVLAGPSAQLAEDTQARSEEHTSELQSH